MTQVSNEGRELLAAIASVQASITKGQHKEFLTASSFSGTTLLLANGENLVLDMPTLDELADCGLVKITRRDARGDVSGYVTISGFAAIEAKNSANSSSSEPLASSPKQVATLAPSDLGSETPRVFISYSWEGDAHTAWIVKLAEALTQNGVYVFFDRWNIGLGSDIPAFMEAAIREATHTILVCTPTYAKKADARSGGVGYEQLVITGAILSRKPEGRFIPVIRSPDMSQSRPSWAAALAYVDMTNDAKFESAVEELIRHLYKTPKLVRPPLGEAPAFTKTAVATPSPAVAALRFVSQGWVDDEALLERQLRNKEPDSTVLEKLTSSIAKTCQDRMQLAITAEPVAPGVADAISSLHAKARQAHQAAMLVSNNLQTFTEVRSSFSQLSDLIAHKNQVIGDAQLAQIRR